MSAVTAVNNIDNLDLAYGKPKRTTRSLSMRRALSLANAGDDIDEDEVEKETLNMMNEATNFMGG